MSPWVTEESRQRAYIGPLREKRQAAPTINWPSPDELLTQVRRQLIRQQISG
jgi:hypothetical protein